ncbi:3-dehydroquinate synthase [Porphyromonas loveana]|uniref:3-dehydroquinate synthase n=2 Tax=Porphyromonas loveana TaxID=1884669 RepID=UPI00359FDDC5
MITVGTDIIGRKLIPALSDMAYDRLFVLCDAVVAEQHAERLAPICAITAPEDWHMVSGGEDLKLWQNCPPVWQWLSERGASRHSILLCIGGGTVTDFGGFVASVYKRGIRTINLSTTLMGMVDASVGGKTGIDFNGIKNEIGSFHQPKAVFCDCAFLTTLPDRERLSGYAEVMKHALLIGQEAWQEAISFDLFSDDLVVWESIVARSVAFKESIVVQDPLESGLRRILNLGHTIGHAVESLSLRLLQENAISHGHAVMIGLISELYHSVLTHGLPRDILFTLVSWSKEYYPPFFFSCKQYPELTAYCHKDKKNKKGKIVLIPLRGVGQVGEPTEISEEIVHECLDFYREMLGG